MTSVDRFHINHVASATRALICLVTLTFDLETGAHYCPRVGNLSYNFGVSGTFRSCLLGQNLSDAPCDRQTDRQTCASFYNVPSYSVVTEWLGCWTCNREVADSSPGRSAPLRLWASCSHTMCLCSPSSIYVNWYRPIGWEGNRSPSVGLVSHSASQTQWYIHLRA